VEGGVQENDPPPYQWGKKGKGGKGKINIPFHYLYALFRKRRKNRERGSAPFEKKRDPKKKRERCPLAGKGWEKKGKIPHLLTKDERKWEKGVKKRKQELHA